MSGLPANSDVETAFRAVLLVVKHVELGEMSPLSISACLGKSRYAFVCSEADSAMFHNWCL